MTDLRLGDCVELMSLMDDASIDAIVCDPPYGLGFMGKEWDDLPPGVEWAEQCIRVLKPGGHLLAFGGTRTYHRLACAIEDAGFEIRDTIAWMYGSGFPKSMDVSKAIDKAAGAERTEVVGTKPGHEDFVERTDAHAAGGRSDGWERPWRDDPAAVARSHQQFAPATQEAARWDGWGTALKPAFEPIVVARKPLIGTVSVNVLEHGTGALNIAASRVQGEATPINRLENWSGFGQQKRPLYKQEMNTAGRWPANVILDEAAGEMLDKQTGDLADSGGASRFFYCAKASRSERNAGLDYLDQRPPAFGSTNGDGLGRGISNTRQDKLSANHHPTVKPVALMRYLVRLVTPPGGIVLDPFLGSGTTGIAAKLERCQFIGIERNEEYLTIAEARIAHWNPEQEQIGMFG